MRNYGMQMCRAAWADARRWKRVWNHVFPRRKLFYSASLFSLAEQQGKMPGIKRSDIAGQGITLGVGRTWV